MSVEMVRSGMEPLPVLPQEDGAEPPFRPGAARGGLIALASARAADFLLLGSYAVSGRQARVSFRFYDVPADDLLATEEASSPIDLSLDAAVSAAVQALMPRVAQRVAAVSRLKAEEAARLAELRAAEVAEEAGDRPGVAFGQAAPQPLPSQRPFAAPPGEEERFRRVELALGFAPFVPVGAPGQYFTFGYAPSLGFLYRLRPAFGSLGVGAHTGLMYLDPAEQDQAAYFRWLIPLGIDLRYSLPENRPFRLYVHLAGGGAYRLPDSFSDQSGVSERLTRVLPYARGGIGMLVGMGEGFGLAVDAQYHAYFYLYRDSTGTGELLAEVVSGILPSVSLYVRL